MNHRSKRVIYQCNVMLNFQKPDAPPNPLDQGYTISNGCCLPRMYEKPALPGTIQPRNVPLMSIVRVKIALVMQMTYDILTVDNVDNGTNGTIFHV